MYSTRPRTHYDGEIGKHNSISTVRTTVYTNPSRKRKFLKTLFKPEKFENSGLAFWCQSKTFWKTELFEIDGATTIMRYPWLSSSQTQIQHPSIWSPREQSLVSISFIFLWYTVQSICAVRKGSACRVTFDEPRFSEWNFYFQIPPAQLDGV